MSLGYPKLKETLSQFDTQIISRENAFQEDGVIRKRGMGLVSPRIEAYSDGWGSICSLTLRES